MDRYIILVFILFCIGLACYHGIPEIMDWNSKRAAQTVDDLDKGPIDPCLVVATPPTAVELAQQRSDQQVGLLTRIWFWFKDRAGWGNQGYESEGDYGGKEVPK